MKLKSKWAVVLPRIVLRLWHSIWIAYWEERLDDQPEFTDTSGFTYADRRHLYHVLAWKATFPQNAKSAGADASGKTL